MHGFMLLPWIELRSIRERKSPTPMAVATRAEAGVKPAAKREQFRVETTTIRVGFCLVSQNPTRLPP